MTQQQYDKWKVNTFANEEQFQAAAIKLISQEFPQLRKRLWHVQNEQHIERREGESKEEYDSRCMKTGAANKAKGKLSGSQDIHFTLNGILYTIELKQEKGVLLPSQTVLHHEFKLDSKETCTLVARTLLDVFNYCSFVVKNDLRIEIPFGWMAYDPSRAYW